MSEYDQDRMCRAADTINKHVRRLAARLDCATYDHPSDHPEVGAISNLLAACKVLGEVWMRHIGAISVNELDNCTEKGEADRLEIADTMRSNELRNLAYLIYDDEEPENWQDGLTGYEIHGVNALVFGLHRIRRAVEDRREQEQEGSGE